MPKRKKSPPVTTAVRVARLRSSVPGLDVTLCGGLLERRGYLLKGAPGTGKTVLASQLCFDVARAGANAVFVTLLSESHGTLVDNLRTFSFFDEALIAKRVVIVSGYETLMDEGLKGLSKLLRATLRHSNTRFLVLDSISAALERAESPGEMKRFLREVTTFASLVGCTTLLVATSEVRPRATYVETIVDGLIELCWRSHHLQTSRTLEILKLRGSDHLKGKHLFDISDRGVHVHPRVEAMFHGSPPVGGESRGRTPFGVERLDDMLRGGLMAGSSTAILGGPGAGKTILGLQFLHEGARRREPSLYFGFFEAPSRVIGKAEGIGLPLGRHERQGLIELLWQPPLEYPIDALAEKLLDAVHRRGVRRLFIDGIDGFRTCAEYPRRLTGFLAALTNELRGLGVTTLLSEEIDLLAPRIEPYPNDVSAIFENLLLMRYVEIRSRLCRLFSIVKVRESDYDSSIREFRVTRRGIQLEDSFKSAEAILSGYARPIRATPDVPPRPKRRP